MNIIIFEGIFIYRSYCVVMSTWMIFIVRFIMIRLLIFDDKIPIIK